MSERVKVRRLSDDEGRQQRIVRRGGGKAQVSVVRYRRAMVVLASAGGNTVEVRQILDAHGVTFSTPRRGRSPTTPTRRPSSTASRRCLRDHPDRVFAFDEFGPLAVHPVGGCCWGAVKKPQRLRANDHKTCGVRQFHACYSVGDDTMWGVVKPKKGIDNSLDAIRSCRRSRPDGEAIFVILDNLSAHKATKVKAWCAKNNVELCFTPTYSFWANPIECHFGPLRGLVLNNSDHPTHAGLTRRLHAYLRWRNVHGCDPALRERLRKERARPRSERQRRWGRPAAPAAVEAA